MDVRDVYAGIATIATLFSVLQNLFRTVLIAVASSPAIHLVLCPAAEFQQLQPVVFHEIKNSGNALVLCFPGTAEGCSIDVNMKPAGAGLVAAIIHTDCGTHDFCPGHFLLMISQGHGVSHYLHSVRQTSIRFYVNMLRNPVADTQKRISVVAVLAVLVDFKFHAEIELAVAIKYGFGLVIVFMNGTVLAFLVATVAIGVIIVIIVIGVVAVNNASAAFAGRVVIVIAGVAEWHAV